MNWLKKMKIDMRKLKKENKMLITANKNMADKLRAADKGKKSVKGDDAVDVKKLMKKNKELQHQVNNLADANRDYEGVIDKFAEENDSLKEESMNAQRAIDTESEKYKNRFIRAVKVIKILNKWLGNLDRDELERFKESEDFQAFMNFYERYVAHEKTEKNKGVKKDG